MTGFEPVPPPRDPERRAQPVPPTAGYIPKNRTNLLINQKTANEFGQEIYLMAYNKKGNHKMVAL